MRWLTLALAALALTGCESTQERSAELERVAKHKRAAVAASGLRITVPSRTIQPVLAVALHDQEGNAVALELRNSGRAEREVPLEITVGQSAGTPYANTEPGLAPSLTSVGFVPAHGTAIWVDDQVTLTGSAGAVSAEAGDGKAAGPAPAISLGPHQLESEDGSESVTGTVANRSTVEQHELAVYALAERSGRIVSAGRAVIASLAPGASAKYQAFLVGGSAHGAQLIVSAPPRTFG